MASGFEYAELQVSSNFSLLRGASHPEELVSTAAELNYRAIALTDWMSMAGIVRAHLAASNSQIKSIVGCGLDLVCDLPFLQGQQDKISILAYPTDRVSYGRLCRLLTEAKQQKKNESAEVAIKISSFLKYQKDLVLICLPPSQVNCCTSERFSSLERHRLICQTLLDNATSPDYLALAITKNYSNGEKRLLTNTVELAKQLNLALVVSNEIYYHIRQRQTLQDLLTCIRLKTTIQKAGYQLLSNSERYLKPLSQIKYLYRDFPAALQHTLFITELASGFSLEQLRYEYPNEICPPKSSPLEYLTSLTWQGASKRYPTGIPPRVKELLQQELKIIHELQYEKYFLTCYDIVRFAKSRQILCQGRGAAANSAVCYCLGITAVDPTKIDLLFARFVSKERNEPPDIDIDFEHERREEVIQYIYQKYGRERAGLTCAVVTYQPRSAIKDVGKALGLPIQTVNQLAKKLHRWSGNKFEAADLVELGIDRNNHTIHNAITLSQQLVGFPRHLSQHVGGFIISEKPLCETVPIISATMPGRTMIEWDKNDIEALGLLKIDILALGMLTCIRKALDLINNRHPSQPPLSLYSIPKEDSAVYQMLSQADTVGVFQVESRAQMSMLPRLRPKCFYDLVIEVAIVRPGPIQGNMVHPYLRRRSGMEKPFYPDKRVEQILGKTLGIPIFQEQALRLAIVLANFSPGEAEQLRRAMAAWKRCPETVETFKAKIVSGMLANGYSQQFAETTVNQLKGFSEYGFPESHAASFALLVYASSWIKRHFPAHFTVALLNSQPLGFYAPAQLLSDAKAHNVEIRPIDINHSSWDCSLEERHGAPAENSAIRLGLRLIKQLSIRDAEIIVNIVDQFGPFSSLSKLWICLQNNNSPIYKHTLKLLAQADALLSMGLSRREALWQIQALTEPVLPLDLMITEHYPEPSQLPPQGVQQSMFSDYAATGVSLKAHPLDFLRSELNQHSVLTAKELKYLKATKGLSVQVAGVVLFRQKPPTAKRVTFLTIEDETGIVNLIIKPNIFEKYKRLIITSQIVLAAGTLEKNREVVYVNVERLTNITHAIHE